MGYGPQCLSCDAKRCLKCRSALPHSWLGAVGPAGTALKAVIAQLLIACRQRSQSAHLLEFASA